MQPSLYYVLDADRRPVPATPWEAASCLEDIQGRTVGLDKVGYWLVSTVFSVINPHPGNKKPRLFETMMIGEEEGLDDVVGRYATWEEAEAGHRETVEWISAKSARKAQDAAEALRQAEAARKARGRWARLRAAWRGE